MPFAASGIYTAPTGATTAAPGEVIRSATWNSIFTDLSTALTQLGEGVFIASPRLITTPGSFTVTTLDTNILISVPAPTITVPLSSTKKGKIYIYGAASTIFASNNSVLVCTGGETINGAATRTLTTNYQSIVLFPIPAGGGYLV